MPTLPERPTLIVSAHCLSVCKVYSRDGFGARIFGLGSGRSFSLMFRLTAVQTEHFWTVYTCLQVPGVPDERIHFFNLIFPSLLIWNWYWVIHHWKVAIISFQKRYFVYFFINNFRRKFTMKKLSEKIAKHLLLWTAPWRSPGPPTWPVPLCTSPLPMCKRPGPPCTWPRIFLFY